MSAAWRLAAGVAAVWLMPWRAARTIRELRESQSILIRALAAALADRR